MNLGQLSVAGDVRIVEGTDTEGRLEVYAFDAWRAVCPNDFDDTDATIACMHMGFGYVCHYDDDTVNNNKRQT